jgi:probable HAF family extracellular repeat protein
MAGLGDLPGDIFDSWAYGVSADGSVVVGNGVGDSGIEAFRWTEAGGMVGLRDLPGSGFSSRAYDVSADGSVVVGMSVGGSGNEAFRWTAAGGMVGLGDLTGGTFSSDAYGVSADGSVVFGWSDGSAGQEAFRWTVAGGMRSVRDILVNDYGLGGQLAGWTLSYVGACSADGSVIVGGGTNPAGLYEAWVARLDGPPRVLSLQVNDGSAQRSRVTNLTVTFNSQVEFAGTVAGAFTLSRNGGKPVSFKATASVVNGVTAVTLWDFTGASTQFDSLADGRYTLTALANQISVGGVLLDGDGDGQPGGNYIFGDAQGLFRFFGDTNGDRNVDIGDFGMFSSTYGLSFGQAGFIGAFDFNGDGVIDIADFGQFSIRIFTVLP